MYFYHLKCLSDQYSYWSIILLSYIYISVVFLKLSNYILYLNCGGKPICSERETEFGLGI